IKGLESLVLLHRPLLVAVGIVQESQAVAGQREIRPHLDCPLEGIGGKLVLPELHIGVASVESVVGVQVCHLIVAGYRLTKSFERCGALAELCARVTEHVVRQPSLLGLSLEAERLLGGVERLLITPEIAVPVTQIDIALGKVGLEFNGALTRGQRFLVAPSAAVDGAETGEGLGEVGLEPRGLLQSGNRLIELFHVRIRLSYPGLRQRIAWVKTQRLPEGRQSFLVPMESQL